MIVNRKIDNLLNIKPNINHSTGIKHSIDAGMFEVYSRLRIKGPPYKKEFKNIEAYNSETKRSRRKLTWIKHAQTSIFCRIDIFSIRYCVKEDQCGTAGLSKNRTK